MIVISSSIVLAPATNPLNTPIFAWKSIVTTTNIAATSAADGYPASNLANPLTHLRWKALGEGSPPVDPSEQYLTITIDQVDPVDYLAIAVHNFGSAKIAVSVDGASELAGSPGAPDWGVLVDPVMLPDDGPVIFRFTPQSLIGLRLRLQAGDAIPFLGVLYAGKLLVAERGTHADHIPINLARAAEVMNGMSETGNFVGRIVLRETLSGSFPLKLLRAAWYRTSMKPFIDAARETPFFFAWKPQEFPYDVGYCTLANNPQPSVHFDTGTMAIDLQMNGVSV